MADQLLCAKPLDQDAPVTEVLTLIKAALKKGVSEQSWLGRLLARKSRVVAGVALANKMARMIWAVLISKDVYRDPAWENLRDLQRLRPRIFD